MAVPDFLTVVEAAKVLRIGPTAAYELAARFEATGGAEGLPVVRLGRSLRAPKVRLEAWAGGPLSDLAPPASPTPTPTPASKLSRRHLRTVIADGVQPRLRKALAKALVAEVRRADRDLAELERRIRAAVSASGTTVTDIFGVGPIMAAYLIGHTAGVARFPTAGHYARFNGTAPIEASSGPTKRHRLNPRGNRQLNHALHMAAVTQVRHDTPGRAYYLAKQAEGKSRKEATRALKRRISDAVYRQLRADTAR